MIEIKKVCSAKKWNNYLINDQGKIYSLSKYKRVSKELKTFLTFNGYERVNLWIDKKKAKMRVNRLIALVFIPNPKNKPQVNHIDGNKLNNNVSNLEWNTCKENINHYWKKIKGDK